MKINFPNAAMVDLACKKFDEDCRIVEETLTDLFARFPANTDIHQVLLKVVTLNALYSTQIPTYSRTIPNVEDIALHICGNGNEIDAKLTEGSPEVVGKIAIIVKDKQKRNNYSFATKYCNWHNPQQYPIWDSRIDRYLWLLQKQEHFADRFTSNSDLWDYSKFRSIMDDFLARCEFSPTSYKRIDKFLWMTGQPDFTSQILAD